ncbi:PLDc N-terminal domain-containing protein [Aeromicrobium sp. CFBP 8757]|uniref:PLDc N-terminal domain-containing protein n=1 Tax=Aeromicrobium sp. CFBP 8757 TaxID=2775288 RepID=UPI001782592A|nr:PLDc N-terminal domain-containing protein [Aeromicrobium sp. CFBP 8757]MBD8608738.1 PLDc N-terminal domain-containing protein [Aeromicrobium sp. CFBP 8757]
MAQKKWSDLPVNQRRAISVVGAVEAALTAAALRDLARRPSPQVRGPKAVWALALFVQPIGPLVYFAAGRRQG